jgi:hypothetical protein
LFCYFTVSLINRRPLISLPQMCVNVFVQRLCIHFLQGSFVRFVCECNKNYSNYMHITFIFSRFTFTFTYEITLHRTGLIRIVQSNVPCPHSLISFDVTSWPSNSCLIYDFQYRRHDCR